MKIDRSIEGTSEKELSLCRAHSRSIAESLHSNKKREFFSHKIYGRWDIKR